MEAIKLFPEPDLRLRSLTFLEETGTWGPSSYTKPKGHLFNSNAWVLSLLCQLQAWGILEPLSSHSPAPSALKEVDQGHRGLPRGF